MRIIKKIKAFRRMLRWVSGAFVSKNDLGLFGKGAILENPVFFENPQMVYLEDHVRIRNYCTIINSPSELVVVKKYTVLAANVTIITNGHRSTVGIPQICLGASHINDKSGDVIIEEDVWVGARAIIMPGVTIGRGAIVSAGAIVTHDVPPYALVVGAPAKIVAKKFELEDVIRHEKMLYCPKERFNKQKLEELFEMNFKEKKTFGINTPLSKEEIIRFENVKTKISLNLPLVLNVVGNPLRINELQSNPKAA